MGWFAAALLVTGTLMVGQRLRSGWLVLAVAEVLWVYVGVVRRMPDIVTVSAVFGLINLYNWRAWGRDDVP